jgi:uncharacterized protein YutE (UPF0331/DUF86 family)
VSSRRRKDTQHLDDAQQHLRVLQEHLSRGSLEDALIRDAVSHRLEVAIDAVGRVSPDLLQAEMSEDWPKIVGMRNILAHQYADLDQEILQNTIDNRLEGLIQLVDQLRRAAIRREQTDAERI